MARILIVDDEELVRAAFVLLLERHGHEVCEATNGVEALAQIRKRPLDLVVTDLVMPEKDGFETIRDIRNISPSLKIIAISGGAPIGSRDILQFATNMGADETFAKPIDRAKFLTSVSRLLSETPREAAPAVRPKPRRGRSTPPT